MSRPLGKGGACPAPTSLGALAREFAGIFEKLSAFLWVFVKVVAADPAVGIDEDELLGVHDLVLGVGGGGGNFHRLGEIENLGRLAGEEGPGLLVGVHIFGVVLEHR